MTTDDYIIKQCDFQIYFVKGLSISAFHWYYINNILIGGCYGYSIRFTSIFSRCSIVFGL